MAARFDIGKFLLALQILVLWFKRLQGDRLLEKSKSAQYTRFGWSPNLERSMARVPRPLARERWQRLWYYIDALEIWGWVWEPRAQDASVPSRQEVCVRIGVAWLPRNEMDQLFGATRTK